MENEKKITMQIHGIENYGLLLSKEEMQSLIIETIGTGEAAQINYNACVKVENKLLVLIKINASAGYSQKRVSISNKVYEIFNENSELDVRVIGIYAYDDTRVMVDFDKQFFNHPINSNVSANFDVSLVNQVLDDGLVRWSTSTNKEIVLVRNDKFKEYLM